MKSSIFSCFIPVIFVLIGTVSHGMGNLYVETFELFRSNALKFHESTPEFVRKTEAFAHTIRESNIQTSSYLVKVPAACGHVCHEKFTDTFGRDRYDILSAEIGMVTTSLGELQDFYDYTLLPLVAPRLPSTHTSHGFLYEYAPFHPEMKIDAELRRWMMFESSQTQRISSSSLRVLFTVHGLTLSEYTRLEAALKQLETDYEGLQRIMRFENGQFVARKRFHGLIIIPDCDFVSPIIHFLSQQPEIHWLERSVPLQLHNHWAIGVCDSGVAGVTLFDQPSWNLTGEGEVIGIADTGLDMTHCQFHDPNYPPPYNTYNPNHRKVVTYLNYSDSSDSSQGHGTHVTSTAAGNGGPTDSYHGLAPDAKIAFADLGDSSISGSETPEVIDDPPHGLYSLLVALREAGATIQSHSWGAASFTEYTLQSYDVDRFLWDYPDSFVLFSAGNAGYDYSHYGIWSPANSKSVLTVGSGLNSPEAWRQFLNNHDPSRPLTDDMNVESMSWFSSPGPTSDGRLKPDLVAPGDPLLSASAAAASSCDFSFQQGTSMATSVAAAVAAKVRQYYRNGYYPSGRASESDGFLPSGALVKATLIHSGQAVTTIIDSLDQFGGGGDSSKAMVETKGGTYPSLRQGYGRLQLNTVLNLTTTTTTQSRQKLFILGGGATENDLHYTILAKSGDSRSYRFLTSDATDPLPIRVTLCYTDAPGGAYLTTTAVLVNDLTLSVTTPAEVEPYFPYFMNNVSTLEYSIQKSNVQLIDIPHPTPRTTYTITVVANQILDGPQPIALVVTGELSLLSFEWQKKKEEEDPPGLNTESVSTNLLTTIITSEEIPTSFPTSSVPTSTPYPTNLPSSSTPTNTHYPTNLPSTSIPTTSTDYPTNLPSSSIIITDYPTNLPFSSSPTSSSNSNTNDYPTNIPSSSTPTNTHYPTNLPTLTDYPTYLPSTSIPTNTHYPPTNLPSITDYPTNLPSSSIPTNTHYPTNPPTLTDYPTNLPSTSIPTNTYYPTNLPSLTDYPTNLPSTSIPTNTHYPTNHPSVITDPPILPIPPIPPLPPIGITPTRRPTKAAAVDNSRPANIILAAIILPVELFLLVFVVVACSCFTIPRASGTAYRPAGTNPHKVVPINTNEEEEEVELV